MGLLKHWFTPHYTNNHRARLLHSSSLMVIFCLFLGIQITLSRFSHLRRDILGIATNIQIEELLQLTNEQRQKNGLSQFTFDPVLSKAARAKAEHMFEHNYWSHTAPDGKTPWEFFRQVGYKYLHAGENLAKEFDYSSRVVEAWMASPTHRANILRPEYQDTGLAVVNGRLLGEETTLVVQLFGTKQPSFTASQALKIISATATAQLPPAATLQKSLELTQIAGITKKPVIDLFRLAKTLSFSFGFAFIAVFVIDGILLWRKGTVRLSSHNLAHVVFLGSLLGAVWFTGIGVIL